LPSGKSVGISPFSPGNIMAIKYFTLLWLGYSVKFFSYLSMDIKAVCNSYCNYLGTDMYSYRLFSLSVLVNLLVPNKILTVTYTVGGNIVMFYYSVGGSAPF
jgi:hypothetical protein